VTGGSGSSTELFDPATGRWTRTAPMLTPRAFHTATLLPSGKVLIAGGASGGTTTSSAEIYSPLTLNPWNTTVAPRQTISFAASGGVGSGYTWALVQNASNGAVDPSTGRYTAGPRGGSSDVVQLTDGALETVRATVNIGPGVSITPSNVSVPPRRTQQFSASGGSGTGFSFAMVTRNSGGDIDPRTGLYTAGATGGVTDTVSATDSLGNSTTVSIAVTASLAITPASVTLQPKASQAFSASGGSGSGFIWNLVSNESGATVNPSTGVYTAGTAGGRDVVGVTDSLGNVAEATVTVAGSTSAPRNSGGCGGSSTTGGAALPWLALALLPLVLRRR
jgi:galactose oxidase-like protein